MTYISTSETYYEFLSISFIIYIEQSKLFYDTEFQMFVFY